MRSMGQKREEIGIIGEMWNCGKELNCGKEGDSEINKEL
jgi:hypothetical protein